MTSGVLKNYHGAPLRVPWGSQAEAGGVFPWEPSHWTGKTTATFFKGFDQYSLEMTCRASATYFGMLISTSWFG